jgi:rubrerythrin
MSDDARGLMLNLATVDPEHEDEFNRWYEEEHLPDVRARFPQITRARRYRSTDGQEPRYLVVYEYDVADEAELNDLASPENPLRQELWQLYDDSVGRFAKRSRRAFWRLSD